MSRLNTKKLNPLLTHWPAGVILTADFLKKKGYYKQLIKKYCDSGWLTVVGRGAYARLNDEITWQGATKALQEQLNLPLHVGGLTALHLHGISQYIPMSEKYQVFYLYNTTLESVRLPMWFQTYFAHCHFEQKKLFSDKIGLSTKMFGEIALSVSAPERAILEVLSLVPSDFSLSHANELLEFLHRLRSNVLQQLLENCCSVKVKRLFLCFAEKNDLPCFKELNISKIYLGSGKRVIGQGGKYNSKWQLSLPKMDDIESWDEDRDE